MSAAPDAVALTAAAPAPPGPSAPVPGADQHVRTTGPVRVVGAGLLGTSTGLALRALGVDVVLDDPSPSAVALACDLGAGRLAEPGDLQPTVVVVAAPPDVSAAVVAEQLAAWPSSVVTDVASVKRTVLEDLLAAGADLTRYVGSHPMAGSERSGAVAGRGDLFLGRPWVLCPAPATSPTALAAVRDLADDLGASPLVMAAGEHDDAVALVSHLPQVAASLVAARLRAAPEPAVALAGQGLRDVTRIAASDPALWVQILGANAAPVAAALRALRTDLDGVLAALEALAARDGAAPAPAPGARAALARAIADGGAGRARIPGKHGTAPTTYATVTVLVPDAIGNLARLFTDVGAAGVNLEDVRLEHSPRRPVGLVELDVLPAAEDALLAALSASGWTVSA